MLTIPTLNQLSGDPRKIVTNVSNVNLYSHVPLSVIDHIGEHYHDPTVYNAVGPCANGNDIHVCHNLDLNDAGVIVKLPISFEDACKQPTDYLLLDSRDNIIMPPVNGSRLVYKQRDKRSLGISAIYAFVFQSVSTWNYVNLTSIAPDVSDWYAGPLENLPALDDYMHCMLEKLIGAIEEITTNNPEVVLELNLYNGYIYIMKYCDFRTWLYLEKEDERKPI